MATPFFAKACTPFATAEQGVNFHKSKEEDNALN
jgi:hypothetical protein